jgi:hypothetical protein
MLEILEHLLGLLHEWNYRLGCVSENICSATVKPKPTVCAGTNARLNTPSLFRW